MYKRFNRKNKKGFTLIELIIVIAILAILAAILVPSMIGYMDEANESVANANARTVYSAATAALTICLTDDALKDSIADIGAAGAYVAVAPVTGTPTTFQEYVFSLLGENFSGNIYVDVNGDKAAATGISTTGWSDETDPTTTKMHGIYPLPSATNP